jgi:hypothetical protein
VPDNLVHRGYDYGQLDDAELESKIRRIEMRVGGGVDKMVSGTFEMIRGVRDAKTVFDDYGRGEDWANWCHFCLGVQSEIARSHARCADLVDEYPEHEELFSLGALRVLSTGAARAIPFIGEEINKSLEKGDRITTKLAKKIVQRARRNILWPDRVCNEVRSLILRHIEKFVGSVDVLPLLEEYDDETQLNLVNSVIDGTQLLEEACATGEVPQKTPEEICRQDNRRIRAACSDLMKTFNKLVPSNIDTLHHDRRESARDSIKSCQNTLKLGLSRLCPTCEGLDDNCVSCNGTARVSEQAWSRLKK